MIETKQDSLIREGRVYCIGAEIKGDGFYILANPGMFFTNMGDATKTMELIIEETRSKPDVDLAQITVIERLEVRPFLLTRETN